ncbi:glycogen synthase GlgA [Alteraurantiacibacter buctensis]|uniref:Glycogen synthase n=1 Tax=Alteraurantiacibacter buctensis TaxID=1503981 RepID=A0A844YX40_9SPHN|nr:glycogen synthase GlgA [Alteraurantiacibacter buctensis]MXO71044.1 glycogen synthase GlgA [Alteraurantiacibacter buctensis]
MIKVLSVASEAVPLVKTGGLADVAGALPAALAGEGVEVTTMLPGYPAVKATLAKGTRAVAKWDDLLGHPARLLAGKIDGNKLLVLDCPALFDRPGGPYQAPDGVDWPDNWHRFAAFALAAAEVAMGYAKGRRFDLVHAHDWQAAMVPAYMSYADPALALPSVLTIHNMAFQGWYPAQVFPQLGLPAGAFTVDGVESYGGVGFLKAGMQAASAITTVSPTYAAEIRSAEFGMGLEGLVQARGGDVSGILNGIDPAVWHPAHDAALATPYDAASLDRRTTNKRAVEAAFGLDEDDGPLFTVISRLTWQKGMDVLPAVLDHLVGNGGRLALLGSGDAAIEQSFLAAATRHSGRIGVRIGYDEALSHLLQGGADAILVPSRFEPCGLTQLYGLAYGCLPVVARTGGLADTVIDANPAALAAGVATGVQFDGISEHSLRAAIDRTLALYRQPDTWRRLQTNGMAADFSWAASARAYAALYRSLTGAKA